MKRRLPIAINAALIAAVLAVAAVWPPQTGPVAVFASPWSAGAAGIVANAGGSLLASSVFPWVIVAKSDEPGFVQRLYDAGAILVTDPRLALGCRGERQSGHSYESS
jgi:hypothetical protein